MLWEIDVYPVDRRHDRLAGQTKADACDLGLGGEHVDVVAAQGYLIEGDIDVFKARRAAEELLCDAVVERTIIAPVGDSTLDEAPVAGARLVHVLPKPGVMDPVADSALAALHDLDIGASAVRTIRKYWITGLDDAQIAALSAKVLANDAIEEVVAGPLEMDRLSVGTPYTFALQRIPVCELDDDALLRTSREGQLSLSLEEMRTIQAHYRGLGREPTDVELETIAQTWSEHCSHKTLAGRIDYSDENGSRHFDNMLKETIFAATQRFMRGADDNWCVSVFADNAGIVRFDDEMNVVFKVETHNHPSAIEPYGGANTGIGGVIRDPVGTGLGARPVCNTDVFCFARPETPADELPPGVLHPKRIMRRRLRRARLRQPHGHPHGQRRVYFDDRYVGNPLVFAVPPESSPRPLREGTSGRRPCRGDRRSHGPRRHPRRTFSSIELTADSEATSGGARADRQRHH
ncbi:MAG: AIR synthase related protein [Pirellulales bacterium]